MTSGRSLAGGIALILVVMGVAIAIERFRDGTYRLAEPPQDALSVTSNTAVGRLSLGFRVLNADLYWIRALQYYGGVQRAHHEGRRSNEAGPEYGSLFSFLDLATSLDPLFNIAYRFGAIFLSEPAPAGPGRPDLAIQLLNKGLAARPDKWEYMQDIGFVHYWWNHDYKAAAEAFEKASQIPNAPWWLRSLAASTLARGGDRRSSRIMWTVLAQSSDNDWLRNSAARSLLQLDALDAIDALQKVVATHRERAGVPLTWQGLIRAGALRSIPADPTGTAYDLTPDGKVRLGAASSLAPLPQEPPAAPAS